MIVKVIQYDPVKGKGEFIIPDGKKCKFRYTRFLEGAIWSNQLAKLDEHGYLKKTKWYHKFNWLGGKIKCQFSRLISRNT